jgi:hypothetical protein
MIFKIAPRRGLSQQLHSSDDLSMKSVKKSSPIFGKIDPNVLLDVLKSYNAKVLSFEKGISYLFVYYVYYMCLFVCLFVCPCIRV